MDDLVIFTNALSAAEVARLATRTAGQFGGLTTTNFITVTVTNFAAPKLSGQALTDGVWSMSVSGDAGAAYTIQTSTNLKVWDTLTTTNPPVLPFRFAEPTSNGFGARFYRVLTAP